MVVPPSELVGCLPTNHEKRTDTGIDGTRDPTLNGDLTFKKRDGTYVGPADLLPREALGQFLDGFEWQ